MTAEPFRVDLASALEQLRVNNRAALRTALEQLRERYVREGMHAQATDLRIILDAYRLPRDPP